MTMLCAWATPSVAPFGSVTFLARACSCLITAGTLSQDTAVGSAGAPGTFGSAALWLFCSSALQVGSLLTGSLASFSAGSVLGSLPGAAAGRVSGVCGALAASASICCLIFALAAVRASPLGRSGTQVGTAGRGGGGGGGGGGGRE